MSDDSSKSVDPAATGEDATITIRVAATDDPSKPTRLRADRQARGAESGDRSSGSSHERSESRHDPSDPLSRIISVAKGLAALAVAMTLLSGCGGGRNMIDPHGTANYIEDVVFGQTGFRPVDIRCPSGIPATPGRRFTCHFTGPEGPYTAYLLIRKVNGRRVAYVLKTQPSSWRPPKLP